MNQTSAHQSLQWSEVEQLDPMGPIQDMDFADFLDIGDLDLTSFSPIRQDHHGEQMDNAQAQVQVSQQIGNDSQLFPPNSIMHDFGTNDFELPMSMGQEQTLQSNANYTTVQDNRDFSDHTNNHSWTSQPQQQQQQQPQNIRNHVYQPPQHVPPTPNSYEMHGTAAHYLHQNMDPQTRAFLETRYQLNKDDSMSFTPLVSPAVTPQDSHFQTIPEFTIPGAYFSPLTSPALQAQNPSQNQHHMLNYHPNSSTAGSSLATSPIDLSADVDMSGNGLNISEPARRTRRKTQAPRSTGPSARVRQSPIVKPQQKRRSTHLSTVIQPKDIDNMLREAQSAASHPHSAASSLRNFSTADRSGTDSISPEPLSESVMGPPPRPASAIHSPALLAHSQSAPALAHVNGALGAPATPASLMSLQRARQLNRNTSISAASHSVNTAPLPGEDLVMLDDFSLPPAANNAPQRPLPARIITTPTAPVSADATPRMTAQGSNIASSGTPQSARPSYSATSSPCVSALASPAFAATPSSLTGRKLESKAAPRSSKKRGSVGGPSQLISPAIRPKISPSIKPLLPEGAKLHESQQALLLASKSNYTHILEGTLLPGVTYPESLSSGLTSKRTSHKIAEQGRRNRINDALKEMQALLPVTTPKIKSGSSSGDGADKATAVEEDEDDKEGGKNGGIDSSKSASSKAATVEQAIGYIKQLQQERLQYETTLKQREAEVTLLREKLQKVGLEEEIKELDKSGETTNGTTTSDGTTEKSEKESVEVIA